jgi:exosome complex RNA-binding protein Csl4
MICVVPRDAPSEVVEAEGASGEVGDADAPRTGDTIYGKVTKVEDRFCKLEILAVGEKPSRKVFQGIILQQAVRSFETHEVQMHNCFRPGDIVRAKVTAGVGGGTSKDTSIVLTTAEDNLGVVFAKSPHTGAMMVPRNWTEFECVQTHTKHKRKVAKP